MRLNPDVRWVVAPVPDHAAEGEIPDLARRLGVPPLVARLLWLRDLRAVEPARAFLAPRMADLHPPSELPDIDRAADRITAAVRGGERIAIFGDYDVDGMTGTALLVRFLGQVEADVIWGIPDRGANGYGLGPAAVDDLVERGARLIVTVDNGITAHAAVERATELGVDVVITDHHLPQATLPPALAVVNPQRLDACGEGRHLCGCAVAFKTAWAVADRLRNLCSPEKAEAFRAFLRDAMGLVAMATVADVVPLVEENRVLVAAGLTALRASDHPGVQALLASARVGKIPLTTEDVAFRIGPRINAAGRLSRPELVIDLLTTTDADSARRLARSLQDANAERRRIEKAVLVQATERAEKRLAKGDPHSLVVHGTGWHRGVIGIVASRLVDRYHRPSIVIGFEGESGRGSCRAPTGVHLQKALEPCAAHLTRYGGHAGAAGLDLERTDVAAFERSFEDAVRDQTGADAPVQTLHIDAESSVDDWTLDTAEAVQRLHPFGRANPEPLFLVRGAEVAGRARLMGKDATHLSFALKQSHGAVRAVGFGQADRYDMVTAGKPLDAVVTPMVNEWQGRRTAELRLVDLRLHE